MSQYFYTPLSPGANKIRLLRLRPHANESTERTELQGELFEYSLQDPGKGTHLYEALSYTWGGEEKPCSITIQEQVLDITTNLQAALLHLRDRFFERIIWIDAICINQKNTEERGQQVQLMAMIYSKAHRVLVWLGETADDVRGALEDIQHAANEESTDHSDKRMNQRAIFNLLQRPWFHRIWVLQEVAAARHVVMMCGSTEIDGYAFCLGLKSLRTPEKLSYTAFPELQSLLSLISLIEPSGLRPKHTPNALEKYSLKIHTLVELVDMFYTRQASDPRDKVYALIGMSSDDPSKAGLQPNYTISWEELFQKLVKFVLGTDVFVETSSQRAVIKSKGCILGQVSSVRRDDKQNVNITSRNPAWDLGGKIEWIFQASAKPIQEHDVICLLHGASKPMIIRLCQDHFAVIVIAATPLDGSDSFGWPETSQPTTQFLRDFLLIWDWENPQGKSQDQEEYKTLTETYSQALEYSKAGFGYYLDKATRLWNDIMILDDLGEDEKAEERLLEARSDYMTVFRKDHLPGLNSQYGRTLLSFAAGEGHEDIVKLLLEIVDPDLKDGKFGRTPLWCAAGNGHEAIVKLLLQAGKVDTDSKDRYGQTPLSWAAGNGHEAVVKLLLQTDNVDADSRHLDGQTPLSWAAGNGHDAVVKLLLETGKVDANSEDTSGQTPLWWAAENGHEAVVKLLLKTGKVNAGSKDNNILTPLLWAAENGHEVVVKLLLENGAKAETNSKFGQTPLWWAAINGHEAVVKLVLDNGAEVETKDSEHGQTPLSCAAENGHEAVVKLLLENGAEVETKDSKYGQTPLWWAAITGHEAVVKLLLDNGAEVETKDSEHGQTPLSWAAERGHEAVVKLLLENGAEVETKDSKYGQTPLWWAAIHGHEAVVKLVLDNGAEVETKDSKHDQTPLSWAAERGHEAVVKLLLENGAEVETKDSKYGQTPLSWATKNGHEAIIKLLLENGAKVKTKDCKYN